MRTRVSVVYFILFFISLSIYMLMYSVGYDMAGKKLNGPGPAEGGPALRGQGQGPGNMGWPWPGPALGQCSPSKLIYMEISLDAKSGID